MKLYGTGAGWYWFLNDRLGTPQKVVDASGSVVWEAGYMPFGEARVLVADVVNNLRFPGQYYDRETGLHYNYHRYYDPDTGRYLTPDPIGLEGGLNLYVYVDGNPVNMIDPEGLMRGARRYRSFGSRNPYATMEYDAIHREIRRIDPNFSVLRNEDREITWRDVHSLRDHLRNMQQRAANRCTGRLDDIPSNWIMKPSKTGGGIRFIDPNNPHNSVRIMPGDPNSPYVYVNSQMPYVRWLRNGQSLDINGNVVQKNSPDAHIPLQLFRYSSGE